MTQFDPLPERGNVVWYTRPDGLPLGALVEKVHEDGTLDLRVMGLGSTFLAVAKGDRHEPNTWRMPPNKRGM